MTRRRNRSTRSIPTKRSVGRVFNIPYARHLSLPRSPIATHLNLLVDRRTHFPYRKIPTRPFYSMGGSVSRIHTSIRKGKKLHAQQHFTFPEYSSPCVRRKTRKEVIFAKGYGGRKLNTRRVRRTASSQFKC